VEHYENIMIWEGKKITLHLTYEHGHLNLDDVTADTQEAADSVPDDEIMFRVKELTTILNDWDHPKGANEERLFVQMLIDEDLKIIHRRRG